MNCNPVPLILAFGAGVALYFLIRNALFAPSKKAVQKSTEEWHKEVQAKWDAERKEATMKEASGQAPTHVVDMNGVRVEVFLSSKGDFVRVDTGEIIGGHWKGPRVLEILGMTEEQKKVKAEMLTLFDKMVASDRVASTTVSLGMGAAGPGLQTYLRYMEKGPLMHIWWWDLYLDYKKVCELTSDENDRMTEAIKNRTAKPELDPKQIEELL